MPVHWPELLEGFIGVAATPTTYIRARSDKIVASREIAELNSRMPRLTGATMGSAVETFNTPSGLSEAARQPLVADQCALVVVDIQEKLLPPIFEKERLVRNSQLLIRLAGILHIPTLLTTQYCKGLGRVVPEIASLLPEAKPMDKLEFSCFGSQEFTAALKGLPGRRNTVLLCGMETHICVMQTALGALQ